MVRSYGARLDPTIKMRKKGGKSEIHLKFSYLKGLV
jgi:hypothetical protein